MQGCDVLAPIHACPVYRSRACCADGIFGASCLNPLWIPDAVASPPGCYVRMTGLPEMLVARAW